ncbi:MAG: hypothetical protein QF449_02015 [Alphaproteobacteria bacterium]|jgi:hypothetical protein|nr:hypothetical protein [Alphaproteobacteria bacterium]MDP6590852.1 hypothetical protein [Alphaproteobacteria bacterium]MDP6816801.1 hypothetical protein [Alphaproteobacteria bacterium]|tara:strand:- start:18 stop:656 length:639 start_codon:yes stop_codon:yes gene_type:complete
MADIAQLGNRIELVSMDRHFHDISLGLYERPSAEGVPEYLVHSYARTDGVGERIEFVMRAMRILGEMAEAPGGRLRFACGDAHRAACKRLFIEAGKLAGDVLPEPRPLAIHDKKIGCGISAVSLGGGVYGVAAESEVEGAGRRLKAIAGGLRKLGEMAETGADNEAAFACGGAHDALVGLLLVRALNVRAVIREEDAAAAQGVLAAPGADNV